MAKKSKLEKEIFSKSGVIFPGCFLIGLGIDMYLKTTPTWMFIGMGVGFLLMYILPALLNR